jgi:hypothetical protein
VVDAVNPNDPHNKYSHWHAALGVYDCDHWMGDASGPGIWKWPHTTPAGTPGQAANPARYAGLHSHDDGIIHMEPQIESETGDHATVGLYFTYGGWKLNASSFTFLDITDTNGQTCHGKPASVVWAVDGKTKHGNPADWRLRDGEVVVIGFVPTGTSINGLGSPPSVTNLQLLVGDPNRGH